MSRREYDLGKAELEVLRVLWEEGPATVRDVLTHLHQRGRQLAYTTVQTVLTRLEHKGFVRSDKSDLAYVYRAAISRERIGRSWLQSLLDQLYDGSVGALVLHLIRTQRLEPDEVQELHRLVDQLDASSRANDGKTAKRGASGSAGGDRHTSG